MPRPPAAVAAPQPTQSPKRVYHPPGSRWRSTSQELRSRKRLELTLAPEERAALDAIAERAGEESLSRVVGTIVRYVDSAGLSIPGLGPDRDSRRVENTSAKK